MTDRGQGPKSPLSGEVHRYEGLSADAIKHQLAHFVSFINSAIVSLMPLASTSMSGTVS